MNELKLQDAILRAGPRLLLGMLHKFSVHAAKGPWDGVRLEKLVQGLESEVVELKEAIAGGGPYEHILDECADVANYCLMIADWASNLGPPPPERMRETFRRGHCGYISGGGISCVREFGHGDGHSFGEQ